MGELRERLIDCVSARLSDLVVSFETRPGVWPPDLIDPMNTESGDRGEPFDFGAGRKIAVALRFYSDEGLEQFRPLVGHSTTHRSGRRMADHNCGPDFLENRKNSAVDASRHGPVGHQ